ncbi:hypothetical protein ACYOEI_32490, partial [Singulisphaera rosea]
MPSSDADAVGRINAAVKPKKPLEQSDVHVHYLEAANTNYVADRYMFIHKSTLKNVANQAERGFAFMNSHATGGISHDAQLPFGRTFAGRFETWEQPDGKRFSRSVLGVYMLAGNAPNGANGPTTDDLSASIDGGTVFDVSIGLDYGENGRIVCDVCGHDSDAIDDQGRYVCNHVPGTTRRMTSGQVQAQKDRGAPSGYATASFVDCGASEISAVYDGAVPGAGFQKAIQMARMGRLDEQTLSQVRQSYAELLKPGGAARRVLNRGRKVAPLHSQSKGKPMALSLRKLLGITDVDVDLDDEDQIQDAIDSAPARSSRPANHANRGLKGFAQGSAADSEAEPQPDPELVQLRKDLADERAAREADKRLAKIEGFEASANATVAELKAKDVLTANQATQFCSALRQAAIDDHDNPVKDFSRLAALKSLMGEAKPHGNANPKVAG